MSTSILLNVFHSNSNINSFYSILKEAITTNYTMENYFNKYFTLYMNIVWKQPISQIPHKHIGCNILIITIYLCRIENLLS